jgi:DNA modification methylase
MEINKILQGDTLQVLKTLPNNSIDCCVTSPPYYALRDYGTALWEGGDPNCPHCRTSKISEKTITGHKAMNEKGHVVLDAIYKDICPLCGAKRIDKQIGLEETPEKYIEKLTEVFMEVYRVLRPEGTLWLNIGDSYNGYKGNANSEYNDSDYVGGKNGVHPTRKSGYGLECKNLKPKDLIGIPWMLAFSLRNAGWYLRQDIIWHKPNPMPESVTDRCTKSHEYIFLFSKSQKYYFDYKAIQEPANTQVNVSIHKTDENKNIDNNEKLHNTKNCQYNGQNPNTIHLRREEGLADKEYSVRNKRDVWSVNVKPFKEAHFATYPTELIKPCILAGCPIDGIVLDPFMGAGTTALVARSNDRNYVGIELNPQYIDIANKRLEDKLGLFI